MRKKYDIVWRALILGYVVKLDGDVMALVDNQLAIKASENEEEIIWITYDMSLNDFIKKCEKLSDEEIASIAMNNALNNSIERKERNIK